MPPSPSWVIRGMEAFGVLYRTGQIGEGIAPRGPSRDQSCSRGETQRKFTHVGVSRPSKVPGLGLYLGGIPSLPRIFLLNNVP